MVYLTLVGGCVVEPPVYCEHRRGRNWAATVAADPKIAGGVVRSFWQRGSGDLLYVVPPDLQVNDVVEFGADYISTTPRRHPERWYGVVVSVVPSCLALQQAKSFIAACVLAAKRKTA
jgi:hypothetical protein